MQPKILLRLALIVAVGAAVGVLVRQLSILDRVMVYFPERAISATPAEVGLEYRDVYLTTGDGVRIHGWLVPGKSRTTLLWLHGNAGNISHRMDNIAVLNRLTGLGVLIVDYRGYGQSEGSPSESGLYLDAEAAIEFLVSEVGLDPEEDIVLFGRSLGVGVAAEMATRHTVRCVILESGFTSVKGMASATRPNWVAALLLPLFDARYDTLSKMSLFKAPVMVVHGEQDDIVPFSMARDLYEAATDPKSFHAVPGAMHNDVYQRGGSSYFQALNDFIENPLSEGESG